MDAGKQFVQDIADRRMMGEVHPEDLPKLAADALEAGADSPSLRMLAGWVPAGDVEPEALLKNAVAELGIQFRSTDEIERIRALPILEAVKSRRLSIDALAAELSRAFPKLPTHSLAVYPLWCYAAEYHADEGSASAFESMAREQVEYLLQKFKSEGSATSHTPSS